MKTLIKLEEVALFGFAVYLFSLLNYEWWFLVLILAPDLLMLGYVFGNKAGAWFYNLFHHTAVAIVCYMVGLFIQNETLQLVGVILFAHSRMDRMFGYGLKYEKGFKFTHLGEKGK